MHPDDTAVIDALFDGVADLLVERAALRYLLELNGGMGWRNDLDRLCADPAAKARVVKRLSALREAVLGGDPVQVAVEIHRHPIGFRPPAPGSEQT